MKHLLDQYDREITVTYKDEDYLVRDNGAVYRKCRPGKIKRKLDEVWTFGKETSSNSYLYISGVRVHRIVATAFHGEPPEPEYVVDHIDTNCRNNRSENLRWLSRLENALKNPVTRKKIEYLCGSIEAFLKNPSMLNDLRCDPNTRWMRTVTAEEARNCKDRMSVWANTDKKTTQSTHTINRKGSFEERVYKPLQKWEVGLGREPGLEMALTPWCAQYMWRANAYFPCCPSDFGTDPVEDYFQNLKCGVILAYSDYDDLCPKIIVHESVILKKDSSILVLSKTEECIWSIVGIELDKKSRHFIHFILGSYFSKDHAFKEFCSKNGQTDFWREGYANAYLTPKDAGGIASKG